MIRYFLAISILFVHYSLLFSQDKPKKMYIAEKRTSPVVVDGNLDEEDWNGKWEGGFIQREPYESQTIPSC